MIWEGPGWLGGCWLAARAAWAGQAGQAGWPGGPITRLEGGNLVGSGGRQSTNLQESKLPIYQATKATKLQATRLIRTT